MTGFSGCGGASSLTETLLASCTIGFRTSVLSDEALGALVMSQVPLSAGPRCSMGRVPNALGRKSEEGSVCKFLTVH